MGNFLNLIFEQQSPESFFAVPGPQCPPGSDTEELLGQCLRDGQYSMSSTGSTQKFQSTKQQLFLLAFIFVWF